MHPTVIIIDEPQTFLHPGALKRLIGVLRRFDDHQYIIATHSPEVVTSGTPATLYRVTTDNGVSQLTAMKADDIRDARALLSDVGARVADLFGADNVLWVEGATEEVCFPLLLGCHVPLKGSVILGIGRTADFEKRRAAMAIAVYERLSQGNALVPSAVGFVLDREDRSDKERADLGEKLHWKVRFLPRRMYENYLLDPDALAAVMNAVEGFSPGVVEAVRIEQWLRSPGHAGKYLSERDRARAPTNGDWLRDVHGADLLGDLFAELSETRVAYDKVRHGEALTRWIAEHKPETFVELRNLVRELLAATPTATEA